MPFFKNFFVVLILKLFFRAPIQVLARSSTTQKPEVSGSTFSLVTTSPSPFEVVTRGFSRDFTKQNTGGPSTARPTDEERGETMKKLMKDEEEIITQFYPDYEYEEEEEEETKEEVRKNPVKTNVVNRFRPDTRPKFTVLNFKYYE